MAIALKCHIGRNPAELKEFAEDVANGVTTIVDVVHDGSNRYLLFYI